MGKIKEAKALLDEISDILQNFRQTILAAACSGRLTEDWRGESTSVRNWRKVAIQSIASVGTGSTPLRSNSAYYADRGTPWITSAATGQPIFRYASEFITDAAIAAHRLKKYPVGALLVAMYGEGKTRGQVAELGIEATINQACAAVVVDELLASRAYVKLSLKANYLQMRELAEGGNQPNLNLSKIKEFVINLPPQEEQTEIVHRVESLFIKIDDLETQYKEAMELMEVLPEIILSKAFRGELVPQDPNDEPANDLLRRIIEQHEVQKPAEILVKEVIMTEEKMGVKKRVPVLDAIRGAKDWISAPQLLLKAGYPNDADPDMMEDFYLQLKQELKAIPPRIERERRGDNDYFRAL